MDKLESKTIEELAVELIKNGYNEDVASKLIIEYVRNYYQESQYRKINEAIEKYLLNALIGNTPSNNRFGVLIAVGKHDRKPGAVSGVFYEYKSQLFEVISHFINSGKLKEVFTKAGIIDNGCTHLKSIKGGRELFDVRYYGDLCQLIIDGSTGETLYVSLADFEQMLASKGLSEECYNIVLGKYGLGPNNYREVPNEGVYFDSDAIVRKISNMQKTKGTVEQK